MGVWYASREEVKAALDFQETARNDSQVDRAIEGSSRAIEGDLHRVFYPWTGTRYKDWPSVRQGTSYRLWLDQDELASVAALVAGGVTIASSDYLLEPANDGPPYDRIEIDLASSAVFTAGDTHQRDVAITGVFAGAAVVEVSAGTVGEAVDGTETQLDVSNSAAVGVGSVVRLDSERMLVTGKQQLDTTQDIGGNLTASKNNDTVPVSDGTAFAVEEVILVDSEKMRVVDISGNNLIVKRAWDGSNLAAHTSGASIYAPRTLVVQRGALGTTAATHSLGATIYHWVPPALVNQLCVAESVNGLLQEGSGYARTIGSGDNVRNASGAGLNDIRRRAKAAHGRQARKGAI